MKNLLDKIFNFWKTGKHGKPIIIAVVVVLVACLCCSATLLWGNQLSRDPEYQASRTAEEAAAQTRKARPTETPLPSKTSPPSRTPLPTQTFTQTMSPEQSLTSLLAEALGNSK